MAEIDRVSELEEELARKQDRCDTLENAVRQMSYQIRFLNALLQVKQEATHG